MKDLISDSRGHTLSVEDNEVGGRRYWSDEVGGGVMVWDTSLVSREMVMLALVFEEFTQTAEAAAREVKP